MIKEINLGSNSVIPKALMQIYHKSLPRKDKRIKDALMENKEDNTVMLRPLVSNQKTGVSFQWYEVGKKNLKLHPKFLEDISNPTKIEKDKL